MNDTQALFAIAILCTGLAIAFAYLARFEERLARQYTRTARALTMLAAMYIVMAAWCAGTLVTRLVLHIALR